MERVQLMLALSTIIECQPFVSLVVVAGDAQSLVPQGGRIPPGADLSPRQERQPAEDERCRETRNQGGQTPALDDFPEFPNQSDEQSDVRPVTEAVGPSLLASLSEADDRQQCADKPQPADD
jgi:hypothetical protein